MNRYEEDLQGPRIHLKVQGWLLMASALFFPFFQKGLPPLALLLGVNALIFALRAPSECKKAFLSKERYELPLLIAAFFLLYLIGSLFTENPGDAAFDLQKRAPLFFFPLLFTFMPLPSERSIGRVLMSFVAGASVACILGFYNALSTYIGSTSTSIYIMYGGHFAYGIHRGYLAIYLLFALPVLVRLIMDRYREWNKVRRVLAFMGVGLLGAGLFMTGSRTAMLIFPLLTVLFVFREVKMTGLKKIGVIGAVFLLFTGSLFLFSKNLHRFRKALSLERTSFRPLEEGEVAGSIRSRMMVWSVAIDLYKAHWLTGLGTGDDDKALQEAYRRRGFHNLFEKRSDAHCQFLQTGIAVGVGGILLLLMIFGKGAVVGMRCDGGLLYISSILFVTALVESVLERQAGIFFLAFFLPLLYYRGLRYPS